MAVLMFLQHSTTIENYIYSILSFFRVFKKKKKKEKLQMNLVKNK